MKIATAILGALAGTTVLACIWDARTEREEKRSHPDLAAIILHAGKQRVIDPEIKREIERLKNNPQPEEIEWLNNLAGAYLRLGQPEEAVRLLEPVREKFSDNYGLHANLGTAYHMLGWYLEAEKEIARDLELNPNAHFGLEKYHLALLQHLLRDRDYQRRHLYVDEWSELFLTSFGQRLRYARPFETNRLTAGEVKIHTPAEIERMKKSNAGQIAGRPHQELFALAYDMLADAPPAYRYKWNLAADTNFTRGVMYMAELNPDQPAAMVMAGIVAAQQGAYNLAVAAFERAIVLGSPQSDVLQAHIIELKDYIRKSHAHRREPTLKFGAIAGLVALPVIYLLIRSLFGRRRKIAVEV